MPESTLEVKLEYVVIDESDLASYITVFCHNFERRDHTRQ